MSTSQIHAIKTLFGYDMYIHIVLQHKFTTMDTISFELLLTVCKLHFMHHGESRNYIIYKLPEK